MPDYHAIKQQFDRDGFVIVPDIINQEKLAELRTVIDGVLDGSVKPETDSSFRGKPIDDFHIQYEPLVRDDPNVPRSEKIRIVFHMTHTHPYFRELSRCDEIVNVVEALIGPNVRYYTDQMFVKPAKHGSEVPWHQDSAYWPDAEPRLLSCWLAIDDVTIENGCVRFIPGTHRESLPHETIETINPNKVTTQTQYVEAEKEVPVVMKAGSASFHHSLTVHRSLPNNSDMGRRALIMIYLPADLKFIREWNFDYGFELIRGEAVEAS